MRKALRRIFNPVKWADLRSTTPVSRVFGLDRGTPVDRYYIEDFLRENSRYISGRVLEIGDNTYTKKFGAPGVTSEILHYVEGVPGVTLVGDLSKKETLPENFADCFVCTQTLNFVYDVKKAVEGIHHVLKKGGVALVTVAGLSQISRYDMERWGDYWRFTNLSARNLFSEYFKPEDLQVVPYGNILTCMSGLHGISAEELKKKELDFRDEDYQLIITIKASKS